MIEEEQRDFDSFNEASTSYQSKKGKPHYRRFPKKSYTRRFNRLRNNLIRLIRTSLSHYRLHFKLLVRVGFQDQTPLLAQARPKAQSQPQIVIDQVDQVEQAKAQGPANFPVILPQHQQLPAVVRHWDPNPFADEDDSFQLILITRPFLERNRLVQRF